MNLHFFTVKQLCNLHNPHKPTSLNLELVCI